MVVGSLLIVYDRMDRAQTQAKRGGRHLEFQRAEGEIKDEETTTQFCRLKPKSVKLTHAAPMRVSC